MPAVSLLAAAPAPLTFARLLTDWQFATVVTGGLLAALVAYLWGVLRVARAHPARPWPWRHTAAFLGGLVVIAVATESGVAAYDGVLFWVHMVQHLLLIMVAPVLLVLGRPVTLLLHASRNPLHRGLQTVLRSRVVRTITHPVVGLAAYTATIVGTHLSGFMDLVLENETVHNLEHVLYLLVGYLFFLPLVGREPIPSRPGPPARVLLLLLAMPADTFTGLALLMTDRNPFPAYDTAHPGWGPSPASDLHVGGAVMWLGGDLFMMVLAWIAFLAWARADPSRDLVGRFLGRARLQTLSDLTGGAISAPRGASDVPEQSEEELLAAYNAYLARLAHPGGAARAE